MAAETPHAASRPALGLPGSSWDPDRELRSLREAAARSRAEEASAMRRSAEEIERCVVRRQLDEGDAMQRFCTGFLQAVREQMEQHASQSSARLDELEQRMSNHGDLDGLRKTVVELLELLSATVSAPEGEEVELTAALRAEDTASKLRRVMCSVGSSMRAAAEASAQKIAESVKASFSHESEKWRVEVAGQTARQHSDIHHRIDEVVERADQRMLTLGKTVSSMQPQMEELVIVVDGTANRLSGLEQAMKSRLEQVETTVGNGSVKIQDSLEQAFDTMKKSLQTDVEEMKATLKEQSLSLDERISKLHSVSQEARDLAGDLQTAMRVETNMVNSRQELVEQRHSGSIEQLEVAQKRGREEWQEALHKLTMELTRVQEDARVAENGRRVDVDRMRAEIREIHREADSSVSSLTARCGYLADELACLREMVPHSGNLEDMPGGRLEEIGLGASFATMQGYPAQLQQRDAVIPHDTSGERNGVEDWSGRLASARASALVAAREEILPLKADEPTALANMSPKRSFRQTRILVTGDEANSQGATATVSPVMPTRGGMDAPDPGLASLVVSVAPAERRSSKELGAANSSPFDDPAR